MSRPNGFTLVEVLVVVFIVGIITATFPGAIASYQGRTSLNTAFHTTMQSLRRAQVLSQAVDGDETWGVYLQNGSVTIFRGASFGSRDTNEDETFDISTNVTLGGLSEIVFDRLTGEPQPTGSITFDTNHDSRALIINEKGALEL